MIYHGRTRSTVKPKPLVIDDFSVWVHDNIIPISETHGDTEFVGFEYTMIQYPKDEYIRMMANQLDEQSEIISSILGVETTSVHTGEQVHALFQIICENLYMEDSQRMVIADLFPDYSSKPQSAWKENEVFCYSVNQCGKTQLYRVIERIPAENEHFTPDELPRYFKPIGINENGISLWTQPLRYEDAYEIGNEVEHPDKSGVIWMCNEGSVDGELGIRNINEPGVWGWVKKEG